MRGGGNHSKMSRSGEKAERKFSNWSLTFCQLHRVIPGQTNTIVNQGREGKGERTEIENTRILDLELSINK